MCPSAWSSLSGDNTEADGRSWLTAEGARSSQAQDVGSHLTPGSRRTPGLGYHLFGSGISETHCVRHVGTSWPSPQWQKGGGLVWGWAINLPERSTHREEQKSECRGPEQPGWSVAWVLSGQPPAPISSGLVDLSLRCGLELGTQETWTSQPSRGSRGRESSLGQIQWEPGLVLPLNRRRELIV